MTRGRPELWENTVCRALEDLGGEANESAVLRWVQDNRQNLKFGWQREVHTALIDHGDGRGKSFFESVSEQPELWRLVRLTHSVELQLPTSPERDQMRKLGRLMLKAIDDPDADMFSALERYLLAIVAYRINWHRQAMILIDGALAKGLAGQYRHEAEQLRCICEVKAQG